MANSQFSQAAACPGLHAERPTVPETKHCKCSTDIDWREPECVPTTVEKCNLFQALILPSDSLIAVLCAIVVTVTIY